MLFKETVAVYCENYTEHTDIVTIYRDFLNVKPSGSYSYHHVLEENTSAVLQRVVSGERLLVLWSIQKKTILLT